MMNRSFLCLEDHQILTYWEYILCNSLFPWVEMRKIMHSMNRYQKQGEDENRVQAIGTRSIHTSLISYINQWAHMRVDEIKWVLNKNQNKVTDVSMGKLKQSQTGPQQKSLKKGIWACLLLTNQKSSKNQQKQKKKKVTSWSEWEIHNKHTWK